MSAMTIAESKPASAANRSQQIAASDLLFRTAIQLADVEIVRQLTQLTGYFSPAEVDVAVELVEDRLSKAERSDYRFIFAELDGCVVGYSCYGPIACTMYSFDLYWIVVHPESQGMGIGRRVMAETERLIAAEGGRRVYVETSSRPQYEPTRAFYQRCGYRVEAVLEDFYAPGDGKITCAKVISVSVDGR
jgi:ribosomal protein S18 acetylase RimI-like enzyme